MSDKVTPMHYELVNAYKEKQYKNLLMPNSVVGKKIHVNKVTLPGAVVVDDYDFWGFELEGNDKKYLISCYDKNGKEISLKDLLPIYPMDLETVGVKGVAYDIINKPVPARIPAKDKISFREIVDRINSSETTNPTHKIILIIFTLMQRMRRNNGIVCTPPGMGKDSTLASIDYIVGGLGAIGNPTVAKLELLTHLKTLAINEVSSIGPAAWNEIQQFLLDVGDMKLKTYKRSRGYKGVEEVLVLKDLSIALYFNDITEYGNVNKFFDMKADGNVKDRFVPLRLWGEYTEDFNKIVGVDPKKYVDENYQYYRDIACSFAYYEQNFDKLVKPITDERFKGMPKRWVGSLSVLFQGISLYAEDEEEDNMLRTEVFKAIDDYNEMLKFPRHYEALASKMKMPKGLYENNSKVKSGIDYFTTIADDEEKHDRIRTAASLKLNYLKRLLEEPTFKARNLLCMIYDSSSKGVNV